MTYSMKKPLVIIIIGFCFASGPNVCADDPGLVAYWHSMRVKETLPRTQAFPDPHADDLRAGANRNFQILSPLDFLAPPPPQTGHAAPTIALLWCPAEGLVSDSLLWLVLEQVAWYVQEGGS